MGMSIQSSSVNLFQSTSSVSNMQQLQRKTGGAAEGVEQTSGAAGQSNFLNAIMQALSQMTQGTTASQTASKPGAQDPRAALQSFVQTLSSALGQTGQGGDSDDGSSSSGVASQGSNIANGIQNLLQQLSTGGASGSTLDSLNSSFQNLVGALNASQGGSATAAQPTLQSFLQNLMQNLGNGQNISGAMLNVQA